MRSIFCIVATMNASTLYAATSHSEKINGRLDVNLVNTYRILVKSHTVQCHRSMVLCCHELPLHAIDERNDQLSIKDKQVIFISLRSIVCGLERSYRPPPDRLKHKNKLVRWKVENLFHESEYLTQLRTTYDCTMVFFQVWQLPKRKRGIKCSIHRCSNHLLRWIAMNMRMDQKKNDGMHYRLDVHIDEKLEVFQINRLILGGLRQDSRIMDCCCLRLVWGSIRWLSVVSK